MKQRSLLSKLIIASDSIEAVLKQDYAFRILRSGIKGSKHFYKRNLEFDRNVHDIKIRKKVR